MRALLDHAARTVERLLLQIPEGIHRFADWLDEPGRSPRIVVSVKRKRRSLVVDFTGSDPQVAEPLNANFAITCSAVFYVIRCLVGAEIPTNSGCLRPIRIIAPEGSVVNARFPAPVAGGNVETSQRIVDVLLGAFAQALPAKVPAASQGTMNNLTLGGVATEGPLFSFYETIAGGAGADGTAEGASGIHTHMTNTLNTPIEALEQHFPLRVTAYHLRKGTGGRGRFRGGEGVVREIEALVPLRGAVLATRRRSRPYGLKGGLPGAAGRASIVGSKGTRILDGTSTFSLLPGERVRMETPGGGGFGRVKGLSGRAAGSLKGGRRPCRKGGSESQETP
jgi:N-methylhydantoinase B